MKDLFTLLAIINYSLSIYFLCKANRRFSIAVIRLEQATSLMNEVEKTLPTE
jgi:hypothetical protein